MTWTATLGDKKFDYGTISCTVQFKNDAGSSADFSETYKTNRPSANWLGDLVRDRIALLNAVSVFNPALGVIIPSADPPPPDPVPIQFRDKLHKLEQMMKAVDLGVIANTLPALVNLQNQIKAQVQADPALLDLF